MLDCWNRFVSFSVSQNNVKNMVPIENNSFLGRVFPDSMAIWRMSMALVYQSLLLISLGINGCCNICLHLGGNCTTSTISAEWQGRDLTLKPLEAVWIVKFVPGIWSWYSFILDGIWSFSWILLYTVVSFEISSEISYISYIFKFKVFMFILSMGFSGTPKDMGPLPRYGSHGMGMLLSSKG